MQRFVNFYLDREFGDDINSKELAEKIVRDVNVILAKNTDVKLLLRSSACRPREKPPYDSNDKIMGVDWAYGIIIWVFKADSQNRGSIDTDSSGSAVIKIGRRENPIGNQSSEDYDNIIYSILHEYGHVEGAGIGEYQKSAVVPDTTGVPPILNSSVLDSRCRYWSVRKEFLRDPMLRPVNPFFDFKFSKLTAAVINSHKYRGGTANLPKVTPPDRVIVKVVDCNWQPVNDAEVKMFRGLKMTPENYMNTRTDLNGEAVVSWGTTELGMTTDPNRLIKVYSSQYFPAAGLLTIWDHQLEATKANRKALVMRCLLISEMDQVSQVEMALEHMARAGCCMWSVDASIELTPTMEGQCEHCVAIRGGG